MNERPIKLLVGVPYKVPGGTMTVKAGELLPDGRTKLLIEVEKHDGSKVKGTRHLTCEDMRRILEENERRRRGE